VRTFVPAGLIFSDHQRTCAILIANSYVDLTRSMNGMSGMKVRLRRTFSA
jgi:hypothetical protein